MALPKTVKLVEVGPRDGLQNEPAAVSVDDRVRLIDLLSETGLKAIEAGSFVSPARVPQMADTAEVMARIRRHPGISYPVLVPNMQGLAAARAAVAEEIAIFAAASESFSRANINCSIAESLDRFAPVCAAALGDGMRVRAYISCVLGCPYEGTVDAARVAELARRLVELGCYEVSLGDTIGVGTAGAAQAMVEAVAAQVPRERLAAHFHDTYGQALANILAVMEHGIATVDCAVAGLGGCPFAPGATGNVASEDVLYMLNGLGIETGVDLDALAGAGRFISDRLGREPASKASRALASRRDRHGRASSVIK